MAKKLLSMLLALSMMLAMLAACNNDPVVDETPDDGQQQEDIQGDEQKIPEEETPKFEEIIIPPASEPYVPETKEKVLKFNIQRIGNSAVKSILIKLAETVEFPVGSTFEYDVYMEFDVPGNGIIDAMIGNVGFLGGLGIQDKACSDISVNADITDYAYNNWYHRVFELPSSGEGLSELQKLSIRSFNLTKDCDYTCYFDNVCIKGPDGSIVKMFSDEELAVPITEHPSFICTLEVVDDPAASIQRKGIEEFTYFHDSLGTLTDSDVIDITVSLNEADSCPGIYFGKKDENSLYGIDGYAFCLDKSGIFLYRLSDRAYLYTSNYALGVDVGKDVSIRLEYDGTFLRGYYLDDVDGVEPWPEFEIKAEGLTDMEYGVMNFRGGSFTLKNTVRYDYTAETVENPFINPIINGDAADPDVLYYDGMYYLYHTYHRSGVYRSPDLINWEHMGACVTELTWNVKDENWWAPDVEYYNGKFYMLVSPEHCLGLAVSDSPTGPFVTVGEPFFREFSIDGHLFIDDDGSAYVYFDGEFDEAEFPAGIFGMKVDLETYTADYSSLVMIMHPEGWEKRTDDNPGTTEGPYILKNKGLYYLIYSGNDYATDKYALGYAVAESPLGPYTKYEGNPVFRSSSDMHGPGHNSFIKTENGDIYNVYHYWPETAGVGYRITGMNLVRFAPTESGVDRLEFYPASLAPQKRPVE